eukprot:XP_003724374.1 PREDICTED: uncharacterized protein LOC100889064 [Strongylocentrotus purpuratus]
MDMDGSMGNGTQGESRSRKRLLTMGQPEPLDLTPQLNSWMTQEAGIHHIGNEQARHGPLYHSSFPDNRLTNSTNGTSKHMSSSLGLDRRRVAHVQPQRGQNINTQGCDSHQKGEVKTVKPRARKQPSFLRSTIPRGNATASHLRANTLPGAQSLDSQAIHNMTEQTLPIATSQEGNYLDTGIVVQSSLQNITVQNVKQLLGCLVSAAVVAPDQVVDHAGNGHAIPISHLDQTSFNSMSCDQIDHTVTKKIQVTNPQLHVNRLHELSNHGRLPLSVDQQMGGFGDLDMATVEDAVKALSYNQQMQVTGVVHHNSSVNEVQGYEAYLTHQRHHPAEKKGDANGRNMMPSNEIQRQAMMQIDIQELQYSMNPFARSNPNAQISGRTVHDSHGQHINPNEQTFSGMHQRPTFLPDPFYPVMNMVRQRDSGVPLTLATRQPHEQPPPDRPTPRNMHLPNFPHHQINEHKDQNVNAPYNIGSSPQEGGRHSSRYNGSKQEVTRRKNLQHFNSLDGNEKAAFLREKYDKLLKRRRRQLQVFGPKYKIALRKMSNVSHELRTLSKMTKVNCPPRPTKMVKCTQQVSRRNTPARAKSRATTSLKDDIGYKNNEDIVIDLTGSSSPCSIDKDDQQLPEEIPSGRRNSRLPSYKEAVEAKTKGAPDKPSTDSISSVARRLLSSSHDFFNNFHTPAETCGETLHGETKRTEKNLTENSTTASLVSSNEHETQPEPKESAKGPQAVTTFEMHSIHQERQFASKALELSQPTVHSANVLPQVTKEHSRATDAPSQTHNPLKLDCPVPCLSDTSIKRVELCTEAKTSSEEVMKKSDFIFEDEAESPSRLRDVSSRKANETDCPSTKAHDANAKTDIEYLCKEKHTLKNAVVRIEDIRKQIIRRKERVDDKKDSCLNIKSCRRKQKRRINTNGRQSRKRRRKSPSTSGSQDRCDKRSRSSSPSRHYVFKDFVPTILPTRTRTASSGQDQSSHALVMELLQHDLDDAIDDETEDDVDNDRDEDYSPRSKHVHHHQARRKKATYSDPSGGELDTISEAQATSGSPGSKPKSSLGSHQPLRVEIGENSQNHIKLKFVNVRNIHHHGNCSSDGILSHRKRNRARKTKHKHRDRTKASASSAEHQADTNPPREDELQAREEVSGSIEADTTSKMKPREVDTDSSVLPLGMTKVVINRKRGETLLHRAAKLGNMEILHYCIANSLEDVNVRDKAGYTSLHDSCVPGHLNVAMFLLNHGADVNAQANDGTRPINDAVENNHTDLVRLLLSHGADPFLPKATGQTCIQQALDQSSEMKSLIFGYLEDMKVERCNLEDEFMDSLLSVEQQRA